MEMCRCFFGSDRHADGSTVGQLVDDETPFHTAVSFLSAVEIYILYACGEVLSCVAKGDLRRETSGCIFRFLSP